MDSVNKPLPGADLQPIDNPLVQPDRKAPSIPDEDDPEIKDTQEQPS